MESLSSRQQSILNRVVETHIETAQPVGSQAITRLYTELYHISYSPATVRHEMGRLEEMGYLTHPHTSAGRVPTDRGWRYYVDYGLSQESLPRKLFDPLEEESGRLWKQTDIFTERALKFLTELSHEASLIVLPHPPSESLEKAPRLQLFLQGSSRILEKPEFQDMDKIRRLFEAFEEKKSKLIEWLIRPTPPNRVSISIGSENEPEELRECALVSLHYLGGGKKRGTIAILGPRRMRYSRAVPLVEHTARWLERMLHHPEAPFDE